MFTEEQYREALESCSPFRRKIFKEYYEYKLRIPHCQTGRGSIITDEEFNDYVDIFVEYDMSFKRFPSNHKNFPNMPIARTIRDYFDYEAKIHGFETYKEFVIWKYEEGPWKPSGILYYMDVKIKQD